MKQNDLEGTIKNAIFEPINTPEYQQLEPSILNHNLILGKLGLRILSPALLLTACGGGSNSDNSKPSDSEPKPITKEAAARFLLQAQFSATLPEIAKVQKMGYESWIDEQLAMPMSETTTEWLNANISHDTLRKEKNTTTMEQMLWKQLFTCPDTLRKRMALALSEIYVVSIYHMRFAYRAMCAADYWDMLNKNAFGNLHDILIDVSQHFAMGHFLDILNSKKASKNGNRQPDENYARELMQLMSIGLVELNIDGSTKKRNGKPIETYDLETVREIAKVFTGYRIPEGVRLNTKPDASIFSKPMDMRIAMHDFGEKKIFGTVLPETPPLQQNETIARAELVQVIDILFSHNNIAPFISKQLIMRFVTSNPSPHYIARIANVFNNNGSGVKGDLKAVIKAILLDIEAREILHQTDPRYKTTGKAREPMLLLCQWGGSFTNRLSVSGKWETVKVGALIGQVPLGSRTVFNFFRPGDKPLDNAFTNTNKVAPELHLIDTFSVKTYSNFMNKIAQRGMEHKDRKQRYEIIPTLTELEKRLKHSPKEMVDYLNLVMCTGSMSKKTQDCIIRGVRLITLQPRKDTQERVTEDRVKLALWMTLICPEFRVQK